MPKTFKQAYDTNKLVTGTPSAGQTQITGSEVVGAWISTPDDAGWDFNTLKQWTQLDAKFMDKTLYDANDNGIVDAAEELKDGTNTVTAAQARTHIDDTTIHFIINDASTANNEVWSAFRTNDIFQTLLTAVTDLEQNKEDYLGNPTSDGQIVSSTTLGARIWVNDKTVPDGGTEGQIIVKQSATEQDAEWSNVPIAFASSWQFDSSTAEGDPGTGEFRLNAATRAATTEIYISSTSSKGIELNALLETLDVGEKFVIYEVAQTDRAALYEISSTPTNNTTWWKIPVTHLDNGDGGEFRNNREYSFQFFGLSISGVGEAPDDNNRTYFRDGTDEQWVKALKGYGETEQTTAATGAVSNAVDNGNRLYTDATGNITSISLTAGQTAMDCTWILKHNSNNVTFPASFKFPGGTGPSTSSGNAWLMGLFTRDSGANWVVSYVENYTL